MSPEKKINWIVIKSIGHQYSVRTYTDQSRTSCGQDRSSTSCNRAIVWRSCTHALCERYLWDLTHSCGVLLDLVFHLARTTVSRLRWLGRPHRVPSDSMSQCQKSQTGPWHLPYRGWKWKQVHTWHINGPGRCCALIALRASCRLLMSTLRFTFNSFSKLGSNFQVFGHNLSR